MTELLNINKRAASSLRVHVHNFIVACVMPRWLRDAVNKVQEEIDVMVMSHNIKQRYITLSNNKPSNQRIDTEYLKPFILPGYRCKKGIRYCRPIDGNYPGYIAVLALYKKYIETCNLVESYRESVHKAFYSDKCRNITNQLVQTIANDTNYKNHIEVLKGIHLLEGNLSG